MKTTSPLYPETTESSPVADRVITTPQAEVLTMGNYVLVLEDDKSLEKQIRHIFLKTDPSVEVKWFSDFGEAREFLRHAKETPRLMLLDIFLPGKRDGLNLSDELVSEGIQIPTIFMSSLSTVGFMKAMRKRDQLFPYLEKPFDEGDAKRIFKHLLKVA
jgi:FixJ family two-component response regulator